MLAAVGIALLNSFNVTAVHVKCGFKRNDEFSIRSTTVYLSDVKIIRLTNNYLIQKLYAQLLHQLLLLTFEQSGLFYS